MEFPDVDGRTILKWMYKKYDGDLEWNDMAQDRNMWRDAKAAVKLRDP